MVEGEAEGERFWYLVAAVKTSPRRIKLTPFLYDPLIPRFLEQQLERYLDIKDRPMQGEYEPGQLGP